MASRGFGQGGHAGCRMQQRGVRACGSRVSSCGHHERGHACSLPTTTIWHATLRALCCSPGTRQGTAPVEALARRGLGRGAAVASPVARRFKPGRLGPLGLEETEVDRGGAQPHLPKEFRSEPALISARARSARVKHFCARTTHSHRSKPTLASLPAPSAFLTHHPALITYWGFPLSSRVAIGSRVAHRAHLASGTGFP